MRVALCLAQQVRESELPKGWIQPNQGCKQQTPDSNKKVYFPNLRALV